MTIEWRVYAHQTDRPIREGITIALPRIRSISTPLRWQVWAMTRVPAGRHRDVPTCQGRLDGDVNPAIIRRENGGQRCQ
jgi:hypothetical protein